MGQQKGRNAWNEIAYKWRLLNNIGYINLTEIDRRLLPKNLKNKYLLDVGVGPPFNIKYYAGYNIKKIILTDISKNIVYENKKFCENFEISNLELVVCDAHALPFKSTIFDVVVSFSVIDHIPNKVQEVITEIARVSRGRVIVTTENKLQVGYTISHYYLQWRNGGVHPSFGFFKTFFPWELKKMMEKAGLTILRYDAQSFRFPLWPTSDIIILHVVLGPINRIITPILKYLEKKGRLKILYLRFGFLANKN